MLQALIGPPPPVLFLDDEPDLVETFVDNVEDQFLVLTATSGSRARDLLRDHDAAVMVTDRRMPGMHGLDEIVRARRPQGRFEVADKGTLFLDEVGELALPLPAKLLRVLEKGEILRLGGSKPRKVEE